MLWQVAACPKCEHHVFLSHCAEDRETLVSPVYDRLVAAGITPWLDREDYYYGRDSRSALRDGILRSRHVVFFVTEAMLTVARGWCVLELALTELLELSFRVRGGQLANVFLPLFLVPQSNAELPRSVWQLARDRGRFHVGGDPVVWCGAEIGAFLHRERQLARDVARQVKADPARDMLLGQTPGLRDRVTKFHPTRLSTRPAPDAEGGAP